MADPPILERAELTAYGSGLTLGNTTTDDGHQVTIIRRAKLGSPWVAAINTIDLRISVERASLEEALTVVSQIVTLLKNPS